MAQTIRNEVWKEIEGYEGLYQVSTEGQVRSLNYNHTGKTKILQQDTNKKGYKRVRLCKKGEKTKPYSVHRLVALTFLDNPNNLPQVNHKDENPANNAVWNLEWCTPAYNMNYGTRNKRASEAKKGHIVTEETRNKISTTKKGKKSPTFDKGKPVLMFTKQGEFIRRFDKGVPEANIYLGKPRNATCIYACIKGRSKSSYGYKWKEVDNYD